MTRPGRPPQPIAYQGTWERRGLIHLPIPSGTSQEVAGAAAETQPARVERTLVHPAPRPAVVGFWDTLAANLRRWPTPIGGPICDCGCLLANPDELCPACVIPWMREQEIRHRNDVEERSNRTQLDKQKAA